jgi:hypothetical protein
MLARSRWTLGTGSRVGRLEYRPVITAGIEPELRSCGEKLESAEGGANCAERCRTPCFLECSRRRSGADVSVLLTPPGTVGGMEAQELEQLVAELLRLPDETAAHRAEISRLAARRRELAMLLNDAIGPTLAAKRLGISRQTFWQVLNPAKAQAIKRRSSRSRRDGATATAGEAP